MKKFILILVASLILKGLQAQELVLLKQGQNEIIRANSDTTKVKVDGAELITIKLLMKYKTECFNDSTRLYELNCWDGMGFESIWEEWGYKPFNCECGLTGKFKYKHKEPTFSDFLDWLSKEYGYNVEL